MLFPLSYGGSLAILDTNWALVERYDLPLRHRNPPFPHHWRWEVGVQAPLGTAFTLLSDDSS